MKKYFKRLLEVTAVVAAVAGVIYFFKNNRSSDEDIFEDDFEDEDFDLDEDLKPAGDRGYVSLTPKAEEKEEATEPVEELAANETWLSGNMIFKLSIFKEIRISE